ncbi:MAG TPA: DUF222 domain-containing protein [Acidimicrobiales bacterium]
MAAELLDRVRLLVGELAALEPGLFSGDDCRVLAEQLSVASKACAAAGARVVARAASCGAHRGVGYRDAEQWLARAGGTTAADAASALEVARGLDDCPATRDAVVHGSLSLTQAREITRTEAVVPGSEAELVALATRSDLKSLRDKARNKRLKAVDVNDLHARQRAARDFRHWRDELGMVCGSFSLLPQVGVPFINRLEAEAGRIRREARRVGSTESYGAHAADAFAKMIAGEGKGHATRADMNLVCDLRAWRRGHTEGDEVCAIVGGGAIPVRLAKELSNDAFFKVILHDGVKIDTVAHLGRHISAELRTALELGAPPGFEGLVCVEPGCGRSAGLEIDHVDPVSHLGPTSLANLKPRCWPHHQEKTERDRKAGLLKPPAEPPP